jgi:hypothetical protein
MAAEDVEDAFYAVENQGGAVPSPQLSLEEKDKEGKNKWAITSLTLGVIGLVCFFTSTGGIAPIIFGFLGFVLGFVGLGSKKRVMAIIGITINTLILLLFFFGVIWVFSTEDGQKVLHQAQQKALNK